MTNFIIKSYKRQNPILIKVHKVLKHHFKPYIVIYLYRYPFHQHHIALSIFKHFPFLYSHQPLSHLSQLIFLNTLQNVLPQAKSPSTVLVASNNDSWHCNGRFIKGQRGMHPAIGRASNMFALCWRSRTSSNS